MDYTFVTGLADQLPEITTDTIVSRTIYKDDAVKAVLFGFAPGQELSEHTAAVPATLHFVSGRATLTLGEDTRPAGPGDWVRMPPNMPHSVKAEGETPLVMLLMLLGGRQPD